MRLGAFLGGAKESESLSTPVAYKTGSVLSKLHPTHLSRAAEKSEDLRKTFT